MRLLIALAFLAVALAAELKPVELSKPASPVVVEKSPLAFNSVSREPVKIADAPSAEVAVDVQKVKIVDAPVSAAKVAEEVKIVDVPVKSEERKSEVPSDSVNIVDTPVSVEKTIPAERVQIVDSPIKSEEIKRVIIPVPDSGEVYTIKFIDLTGGNPSASRLPIFKQAIPDISPLFVAPEIMRQVAEMRIREAENMRDANPFAFDRAEPLNTVDHLKIVDSPANEMNAKMEPNVVVVDEPLPHAAIPEYFWRDVPLPTGNFRPIPPEMLR